MDVMDEEEAERSEVITVWEAAFKKATDFDLWGQPVEARECYLKLATQMRKEGSSDADAWLFSDQQKSGDVGAGISLEDSKKIEQRLRELLCVGKSTEFPVKVSQVLPTFHSMSGLSDSFRSEHSSNFGTETSDEEGNDDFIDARLLGNLLPPVSPVPGKTALTVRIEKMGLKHAPDYIDPFITVLVTDISGMPLCASQDTPVCKRKGDNNLFFGFDVHIQQLLETFPPGFALFFEFKHYKPQKRKISSKCWAFMEKDEIKEGVAIIELNVTLHISPKTLASKRSCKISNLERTFHWHTIYHYDMRYKKPTDFRRRKLHLLTVKPLYLHLKLSLY
ncbi:Axin interactor, dorsalization-associated protein A [Lamellibrachia satsuma]|nr:Axin interactor, dorsalization-associated protein A [Lamellibrachia satsuma]